MGLLLLRTVTGGAAVGQGALYLAHNAEPTAGSWTLGVLAILCGIGLIAGFLTPGAAAAVSATTFAIALTWAPPAILNLAVDRVAAGLIVVDAVALALLGPGAHSVDAYLFGRREIIVPRDPSYR